MDYNRKLVLSDGTVFFGNGFGSDKEVIAEVVFNTGMTGYQDVLTDPSYYKQMVCMTYPLIGNSGINDDSNESKHGAAALIVKQYCEMPSNWRSSKTLADFLDERNIPGLCDVDTRALMIKIRRVGVIRAIIVDVNVATADAVAKINAAPSARDHVKQVAPKNSYTISTPNKKFRIVFIAFNEKNEIINELVARRCEVIVVPYNSKSADIDALNPDGIVIGNGPGNPVDIPEVLPVIRNLQTQYPLFSVCLGHQLFALANGATTSKMKFGHHGHNVSVKDLTNGRTFVTTQSHSYQVDKETLKEANLELTHFCLNDDTVEGLKHIKHPAFSVSYKPEAHLGPNDSKYLFDQFIASLSCPKC